MPDEKRLTRGRAIRKKCLECCCGSAYEVRMCICSDCPLYRYRLGREDTSEGKDTIEQAEIENRQ